MRKKHRKTVQLRYVRGIPKHVMKSLQLLVPAALKTVEIKHKIGILIVPHGTIQCQGDHSFGLFMHYPGGKLQIVVAAGMYRLIRRDGERHAPAILDVLLTLLHELGHYEQYRNGGLHRVTERGIQVRTRITLYRKFLEHLPSRLRRHYTFPL